MTQFHRRKAWKNANEVEREQLKLFAYAWVNNCQDLAEFTRQLEGELNSRLSA